jgi:hypothetical protein
MEKLQTSYYECQSESAEHTMRFVYDPDENELYAEIQLVQYRNVFKRIWVAIKYVFGYQCRYGHWDCWLLKPEDCEGIGNLLNKVVANKKLEKNEKDVKKTN